MTIPYLLKHEDWGELKKILTRIAEGIESVRDEVETMPKEDIFLRILRGQK